MNQKSDILKSSQGVQNLNLTIENTFLIFMECFLLLICHQPSEEHFQTLKTLLVLKLNSEFLYICHFYLEKNE